MLEWSRSSEGELSQLCGHDGLTFFFGRPSRGDLQGWRFDAGADLGWVSDEDGAVKLRWAKVAGLPRSLLIIYVWG